MSQQDRKKIRTELACWFKEVDPTLAAMYEGAVRMMDDEDFPGRIRFVPHAIREILNVLPFVLDHKLKGRGTVMYYEAFKDIATEWPDIEAFDAAETTPRMMIELDRGLVDKIDLLVRQHKKSLVKKKSVQLLVDHLSRSHSVHGLAREQVARELEECRAWFQGLVHQPVGKDTSSSKWHEFDRRFEQFEEILHSFVGNLFTIIGDLDDVLEAANG